MNERVPEGWELIPFKDVCFFQEGPGLRNWQYRDHGIKFINIRCIKDGDIDTSIAQHLSSDEVNEKYQHFLLNEGDYILSSSGTIGRLACVKKCHLPLLLNTSVIRFRSSNGRKLDSLYLRHFLQSKQFFDKISEQSQGSAQVNFGPTHLNVLKVVLPSLPEQKKISSILTSVDEVIEKTQSQIDKLQDLKKGTMNELLTKGIGHTEFKDSELGRIPKSWKVSTLIENSSPIKTKNEDNNMNILTISAQMGMVNQKKYFKKYVSSKDVSHYTLLKKGDFAYNKSYSKGHPVGVVRSLEMYDKGVLSPLYLCFSITSDLINRSFITYYFDSYYFEKELNLVVQEGARAHGLLNIPVQDFYSRKILIPPLEEQIKITKTLSKIENILNLKKQKLLQIQSLKKSLMQDLLTGKVRLTAN